MNVYPLSYWIIAGIYILSMIALVLFWTKRTDCFTCSIPTAISRSLILAIFVAPTVIPSWILIPVPVSILSGILIYSVAIGAFSQQIFESIFILCILPFLGTASAIFTIWVIMRRWHKA